MKLLVDSIAGVTLTTPGSEGASSVTLPSRTQREIQILQQLIDASLSALKHADANAESNGGSA
jgi:hypothetical protein